MHCFIFRTALPHTFQIRLPVSEYRGTDETGIPVRAGQMPGVVKNGANGSYLRYYPSVSREKKMSVNIKFSDS